MLYTLRTITLNTQTSHMSISVPPRSYSTDARTSEGVALA
jgi:hypothetical protein